MNDATSQGSAAELASLPPMSLDRFMQDTGLCPTTIWRYRKRGWLRVENIAGRNYITRAAILEFNTRMANGEFAKARNKPPGRKAQ